MSDKTKFNYVVKKKMWTAWQKMVQRCCDLNCPEYKNYGGRGISVCEQWINSKEQFVLDVGLPPTLKHSLERIDVDGNYEPSNCRWATSVEQQYNKRNSNWEVIIFNRDSKLPVEAYTDYKNIPDISNTIDSSHLPPIFKDVIGAVKLLRCDEELVVYAVLKKDRISPQDKIYNLTAIRPIRCLRKRNSLVWEWKCDCGKTTVVRTDTILDGNTKSCGCLQLKTATTHGQHRSKCYRSWEYMKAKCYNKNNESYPGFGGKGISVCIDWLNSFEAFYADMGPPPIGAQILKLKPNCNTFNRHNCFWSNKR